MPPKSAVPVVPPGKTLVYFLGYPDIQKVVVTTIKGEIYSSPSHPDGSPHIGGTLLVDDHDLKEFMLKNTYQKKSDPTTRAAYTTDPNIGSIAARTGKVTEAAAQPTMADMLKTMDADSLREALRQKEEGLPAAQPEGEPEGEPVKEV